VQRRREEKVKRQNGEGKRNQEAQKRSVFSTQLRIRGKFELLSRKARSLIGEGKKGLGKKVS